LTAMCIRISNPQYFSIRCCLLSRNNFKCLW